MLSIFEASAIRRQIRAIRRLENQLMRGSHDAIRERSLALRFRAMQSRSLRKLRVEAFALCSVAIQKEMGIRLFDEQLIGAWCMAGGRVIEMATGQGKTLAAIPTLYLVALQGKGVHLATSNDYLALRDAEQNRSVFEALGLSVGTILEGMNRGDRRASYRCDVTYGCATEFGFDFLRDRLRKRESSSAGQAASQVMRGLHFLLADEADAVMIDEANVPLVISTDAAGSSSTDQTTRMRISRWAAVVAPQAICDRHYQIGDVGRAIELTLEGRQWARQIAQTSGIGNQNPLEVFEHLETAIYVFNHIHRDQHYLVRDERILLISETTGRLGEDRRWQANIQNAIQAREGLPLSSDSTHAARMTVQCLFLAYAGFAGMTGTAQDAAREISRVYRTSTRRIPAHQTCRRVQLPSRCCRSAEERWSAIAEEANTMQVQGRPVLIGTRSVGDSEQLSAHLARLGIDHRVLNAKNHSDEAAIVAAAGGIGHITVATGMAGRGTDIRLAAGVSERGGLHVIVSELNSSRRMDRQLIGRCARQGDPGSYRVYFSEDDEILREAERVSPSLRMPLSAIENRCRRAQRIVSTHLRRQRFANQFLELRRMRALSEIGRDPLLDAV